MGRRLELDLPPLSQGHSTGSKDLGGHKVVVFALGRGAGLYAAAVVVVVIVVAVQLIDKTAIVEVVEVVDVEFTHGEAGVRGGVGRVHLTIV